MTVELEIRLFATLKDRAGRDRIRVELPDRPATAADVLTAVAASYPALAPALPTSLLAVNRAFAGPDTPVKTGDEVALFPPVSGGQSDAPAVEASALATYFAVSPDPLDIDAVHARLGGPDIGALVSFTGFVRGRTQRDGLPAETLHLEYEAYEAMATEKMAQIAQEIRARWPMVRGVALVQRLGRLDVGEVTTFVACAGRHRDQGVFEAARYGIDRLKEIVPVWKKEVGADRSVWLEGHYRPTPADNLKPDS
ncbi:MAG TPA: molybdenum cofactor biosynthesis protein MoaE [Promineifilum sp.]|nr:molybdenum cofactor biosynthesis protein MoaE [Promineifilum sp.]HQF70033.1 molybdenum cofactor biosynthesis protein MoaE [Promineifilum sp.]